MTSGIERMPCAMISRRTSSWPKLVHLHKVFGPDRTSSPKVKASRVSTRPVHDTQLADALQLLRTASRLCAPLAMDETTCPFVTPLQPQISASSESAATAALGSARPPPEAKAWPKINMSRSAETSSWVLRRSKYQFPSAVSP